jgi:hypothetical protein
MTVGRDGLYVCVCVCGHACREAAPLRLVHLAADEHQLVAAQGGPP